MRFLAHLRHVSEQDLTGFERDLNISLNRSDGIMLALKPPRAMFH